MSQNSALKYSIITPIFNKYELTKNCLISLRKHTPGDHFELIIIDNASSDLTKEIIPQLGKELFGDNFHYIRNEENKNFAGASNQGAQKSRAETLFFLNNDTLLTPNWEAPLLKELHDNPKLGAVGPLLSFENDCVQHIGATVKADRGVYHFYTELPSAHRLALKKRSLPFITAAALMLRKKDFFAAGGFFEGYVNGFEDVELCWCLRQLGFYLTVEAKSKIYHLESQSPRRHKANQENDVLLRKRCPGLHRPDFHNIIIDDGYVPYLGRFFETFITLPPERLRQLDKQSTGFTDPNQYLLLLADVIFWEEGYKKLAQLYLTNKQTNKALEALHLCCTHFPSLENLQQLHDVAVNIENQPLADRLMRSIALRQENHENKKLIVNSYNSLVQYATELDDNTLLLMAQGWRKKYALEYFTDSQKQTEHSRLIAQKNSFLPEASNIQIQDGTSRLKFATIIPVYNKWSLTRDCLQSLRDHTPGQDFEVLLVDNASSDETKDEVNSLGKALFGENFHYIRNEENKNFSGACNQGAVAAKSDTLFFLNNDTLLTPNWSAPLCAALEQEPTLGAVGPVLLYPESNCVQHIGATFHPTGGVSHFYRFVPGFHPLSRKRRKLNAITGAALMLRKKHFFEAGGFFEGYRNGFEDVELSHRLRQKGLELSVIGESTIYHLESQTPGRNKHECLNSNILLLRCPDIQCPDLHQIMLEDGYLPFLNVNLSLSLKLPQKKEQELNAQYALTPSLENCQSLLQDEPFWETGYNFLEQLYWKQNNLAGIHAALILNMNLFSGASSPEILSRMIRYARASGNKELAEYSRQGLEEHKILLENTKQLSETYYSVWERAEKYADAELKKLLKDWRKQYGARFLAKKSD